jgi:GGDEF domain-containing protein
VARPRPPEPSFDVRPWLEALRKREPAYGRENRRRYRWDIDNFGEPGSRVYRLSAESPYVFFRPREAEELAAHRTAYAVRLMEPIVLAAQFGLWGAVADDPLTPPEVAAAASDLLVEATPIAENDLARWFAALDPWRDTLALALLSAEPQAMSRLRDMVFALALRGGSLAARHGLVKGLRYPFYDRPLVSANAYLATGLWRSGIYPSVIPELVAFVSDSRRDDGGWGDEGQPSDVMTTLAAAELLGTLDPDFDLAPTVAWFVRHQEPAGWWRALDPEVPWLTAAVADFLAASELPFAARFRWPAAPIWARDRLSGLTTLASLEELELILGGLTGLARQPIEAAFVDLAGFGAWNTAHGQVRGDEVIKRLGEALGELPDALAVRIGGDEFILLGKPGGTSGQLAATLDRWRASWPADLARIDAANVAPRIVVTEGTAGELRALRGVLGEQIGVLKHDWPNPAPEGVLRRLTGHG